MGDHPPQGTGAVPGDAMSLTAAERLIVQALILSDATAFDGADIAAILADTVTIAGIIADIGVFPTVNYADIAAFVEAVRTRLIDIETDTGTITWGDITGIVNDLGVFPTANYATFAAFVEDNRTRLLAIVADTGVINWGDITAIDGIVDDILTDTTEGKERRWKETYIYETEFERITNAGEESVTPPTGISPVFPAGATLRRATLVAALKAANDTAALHKIGVTLQYQIAGGGWNDLIDLTAVPPLMLPEVEGTGDAVTIVEDMIGLFTSGQLVEVQFLVDSTNAAAVNYVTTFVLSLEFDLV